MLKEFFAHVEDRNGIKFGFSVDAHDLNDASIKAQLIAHLNDASIKAQLIAPTCKLFRVRPVLPRVSA
jgi:hypothetical protein